MALRGAIGVLAVASFVAGCPAFVYDPPYVAEEADAAAGRDAAALDGSLEDGAMPNDASAMTGDAEASDTASPDAAPRDGAGGDGYAPGGRGLRWGHLQRRLHCRRRRLLGVQRKHEPLLRHQHVPAGLQRVRERELPPVPRGRLGVRRRRPRVRQRVPRGPVPPLRLHQRDLVREGERDVRQ